MMLGFIREKETQMTDAVETMAYAGEVPWHGLGTKVADDLTPDQMMVAAGLDWQVVKQKLRMVDGPVVKGKFALARSTDKQFLSICSDRYRPVQNKQVFEFFDKFVKAGHMKMHTAGSLMDGKYVWALAEVGDQFKIGKEDVVKGFVLLMSPHVVGKPLVVQHTSIRVVCWNTLNMALGAGLKGAKGAFKMNHVRDFDMAMYEQAEIALGLSKEHLKTFSDQAAALSEMHISREQADDFFKQVFKLDEYSLARQKAEDEAEEQMRKRTSPVLHKLRAALDFSPGAKLPGADGTLWGAFNAVTYVVDHKLGGSVDNRLRDVWLGYRGQVKRDALKIGLEMAGVA